MHLVQLLLPLHDNAGVPFPRVAFEQVRAELTDRYGGVTAYLRSPASGVWTDEGGEVAREEVVMVEVMVRRLERRKWAEYRRLLEERFRQVEIVVRALRIDRL